MPLDPARYAELFRSERQDQLESINRALLALETERESPAAVAEVFRAVHTMKGMSATIGYQALAEFAHEFESLLDRMRGAGWRAAREATMTASPFVGILGTLIRHRGVTGCMVVGKDDGMIVDSNKNLAAMFGRG